MRYPIAGIGAALIAMLLASGSNADRGERCPAITDPSKVGLYVLDDRQTAVEGSLRSAQQRGDDDWTHLFFEVTFAAKRLRSGCVRIGWRVEPYGPTPVDAADFGGKLPSGVVDMRLEGDSDYVGGEIELWVPDDGRTETPEQFRIVFANPLNGRPLTGLIGRYDGNRGVPIFRGPASSFDLRNRLIMTVEDAPEQRRRR